MKLSVEQGASMEAFSRSMENLLERTLKLNKRILEGFEKEAKYFFTIFLDDVGTLIQRVNVVKYYAYEQGMDKVVAEVSQVKNIQWNILFILRQMEISCRTLADAADSIVEDIRILSSDKEGSGGELGQLATPVLQNAIAAMLVDTLKFDRMKIGNIHLGKAILSISLALATVKLADSDDVISRLIGAPITAFLAGYTYTGNVYLALTIAGVVFGLNGATEIGKFLGDELIKYINKKWDMDLPSVEEMGMKNYSIIDFIKIGFSPEGIQMLTDHPLMGLEVMQLVLFGPDFSWEKFWEEEQQKLISALFGVFGLSSPITQNSEEFGAGMMLGIINGFEAEIEEFRQMIEDWIENDVKPLFNKNKWIEILDGIPKAFLVTFQTAFSGVAGIIGGFVGLGEDAANGFIDGVTKQKSKLASEIEKFANIPINVVRATLDEHSPSRVMFQLGNFAMQGFQNGIESLYSPTLKSLETFGKELQFVPAINNIPNDRSIYTESLSSNSTYGYSNNSFLRYIEQSLHSDMKRVLSESLQNKTNSPEIRVFIGDREITDVAIEGINRRTIRNQKSPLI